MKLLRLNSIPNVENSISPKYLLELSKIKYRRPLKLTLYYFNNLIQCFLLLLFKKIYLHVFDKVSVKWEMRDNEIYFSPSVNFPDFYLANETCVRLLFS